MDDCSGSLLGLGVRVSTGRVVCVLAAGVSAAVHFVGSKIFSHVKTTWFDWNQLPISTGSR